jgi:hypothetical protein
MRELTLEERAAVAGGVTPFDFGEVIAAGAAFLLGAQGTAMFGFVPAAGMVGTFAASTVLYCW